MSMDRREEFYEQHHLWRAPGGKVTHALTAVFRESNADRGTSGGIFLFTVCARYLGRADAPTSGNVFRAPREEATCRRCVRTMAWQQARIDEAEERWAGKR